jgi:3-hydroxyacyl-[acyl-carrier-protein] dehydratase
MKDGRFQFDLQRLLPHRYPFLLVDRVTEFVPGERIAAVKNFSAGDEICQGAPAGLVPASILVEAVTQLGAILVLERPDMQGKVAMILQIPSARMLNRVRPGEELRIEAQVVKFKEQFGELRGAVYRDNELVADGHMRFVIADAGNLRGLL